MLGFPIRFVKMVSRWMKGVGVRYDSNPRRAVQIILKVAIRTGTFSARYVKKMNGRWGQCYPSQFVQWTILGLFHSIPSNEIPWYFA